MNRLPLVLALAFTTVGCSRSGPATPTEASAPSTASSTPDQPPAAAAAAASEPLGRYEQLIPLAAVKALPKSVHVPVPGYPGKGYHLGAFTDEASWSAFVKAHGGDPFGTMDFTIDWTKDVVAFVVLDAQTNDLSFQSWSVDDTGAATLAVTNSGIEPHYPDATPAVLVAVPRPRSITVQVNGSSLGTVTL